MIPMGSITLNIHALSVGEKFEELALLQSSPRLGSKCIKDILDIISIRYLDNFSRVVVHREKNSSFGATRCKAFNRLFCSWSAYMMVNHLFSNSFAIPNSSL